MRIQDSIKHRLQRKDTRMIKIKQIIHFLISVTKIAWEPKHWGKKTGKMTKKTWITTEPSENEEYENF